MKLKYPPTGVDGPPAGRLRQRKRYRSYQRELDVVVQSWPKSWRSNERCQQFNRDQFKLAQALLPHVEATFQATARNFEINSPWTYKDFLISSMYGRSFIVETPEGAYLLPTGSGCPDMPENPATLLLDQITTQPYSLLFRGPNVWGSTKPSAAGQILVFNGNGYSWQQPQSGGGGAGGYSWYDTDLNSTHTSVYQWNSRLLLPAKRMASEKITIIFQGPTTANMAGMTAWIGEQAESGNPYDFAPNPVPVSDDVIIVPQNMMKAYTVDYAYNADRRLLISMWWGEVNPTSVAFQNVNSGVTSYERTGVTTDPAGTLAPSGSYSAANRPIQVRAVIAS